MFNQFTGIGNLSKDPESRQAGETPVATFTVCCDCGYGDKKHTEFVKCVSFGKTADVVSKYLTKGSKVLVQGEMKTRKWTDKEGNDKYTTEITVREMKMLGSKPQSDDGGRYEPPTTGGEDVPF